MNISPLTSEKRITFVTRRKLQDIFAMEKHSWSGKLDELTFLSRLYNLDVLDSHDYRYTSARDDIRQHRLNNLDWSDDWVFIDNRFGLQTGPDVLLLDFLAEALHPLVRDRIDEVEQLEKSFNSVLSVDGYELFVKERISGHPVFGWRSTSGFHQVEGHPLVEDRPLLTNSDVLHEHLKRIDDGLEGDPAQAISSSKELVESLCKIILERSGIPHSNDDDLPKVYRKVAEALLLNAESVAANVAASQTSQKILRTLVTTVQCLSELRNELGLGHGRSTSSAAIQRHARLAFNATVTICEFLLDTWHERVETGKLSINDDFAK